LIKGLIPGIFLPVLFSYFFCRGGWRMESRLKKSHRLIRLIADLKSAPDLTVEQLPVSRGISRAQFYKDKTALADYARLQKDICFTPIQVTVQEDDNFGQRYRNAFSVLKYRLPNRAKSCGGPSDVPHRRGDKPCIQKCKFIKLPKNLRKSELLKKTAR